MKRVVSILLAIAVLLSFAGCGKDNASTSGEKLTITWMSYPMNQSAEEGTPAELLIEEKFNVELKPIFYANQSYNDKKTMLLAGGEVPDLIYELDPSYVMADVDQGFLAEVPYELIAKHAPTAYKTIKEVEPKAFMYSYVDGKNYGIPNLSYGNMKGRLGLWRMDWLKKVGINEVPDTIDEMHDALYKITKNDPDGNGKDDTWGMSGDILNWHTTFTEIFGAYGVVPFNWMEQDGKVVYGGFAKGTEEAISTIAKWYSEGLIHPDFTSDNVFANGKERFSSGVVGYINQQGGYYVTPQTTAGLAGSTQSINPGSEVQSAKFIVGPDGHSGTQCWGAPTHIVSFGEHLEDEEEKLIKILEIFEGTISDSEFLQKVKMGDEGVNWEFKDASVGFKGSINWLPPYDDAAQRTKYCVDKTFGAPTFFVPLTAPVTENDMRMSDDDARFSEEYKMEENGHADLFFKPDVLPSAAEYFNDLRSKQINILTSAIKGEITPEEYTSQFRKVWEENGGLVLEEEAKNMGAIIEKVVSDVNKY